jgi:thiol-disulfide isomerase/thioredoxin
MIPRAEPRIETDIRDILEDGPILRKKGQTDKDRETLFLVEQCSIDEVKTGKYVCLLLSAEWCAPCHYFVQMLKEFYSDANIDEKQCEIIYLPLDKTEEEFREHYATMPWFSMNF